MIGKCNRFVFKWIALLAFLLNLSVPVFSFETKSKTKLYTEDLELVIKSLDDKQSIFSEVELDEVEEDIDESEEDFDDGNLNTNSAKDFQNGCYFNLDLTNLVNEKLRKSKIICFSYLNYPSIFIVYRNLRI